MRKKYTSLTSAALVSLLALSLSGCASEQYAVVTQPTYIAGCSQVITPARPCTDVSPCSKKVIYTPTAYYLNGSYPVYGTTAVVAPAYGSYFYSVKPY